MRPSPVALSSINITSISAGQSCYGTKAGNARLADEVQKRIAQHPCYDEQAHRHYARIHVPVAPACNIQCNYCNRKYDCANESRPGVTSERLTPELAARKVLLVAERIPQLSVVGIAGPGDSLAAPRYTFDTFERVSRAAPHLKLCLATNGLELPQHVAKLKQLNVDHVTVTINMIDPEIGAEIYSWVCVGKKRYTGRDAARLLHARQMEGLERLKEANILCKVNSVLIPGVNDNHLIEVNRAVTARGAFVHNIVPLISSAAHGTAFGLSGQREPTVKELSTLQDRCEGTIRIMRHCRQCRADAVGLLGNDRGAEFAKDRLATMPLTYDAAAHRRYLQHTESTLQRTEPTHDTPSSVDGAMLVAVASNDDRRIDAHFGRAQSLSIYRISRLQPKLVIRHNVRRYCHGGDGDDASLDDMLRALAGCRAVFVARIGLCPRKALRTAGIDVVDRFAFEPIDSSLRAYFESQYSIGLTEPSVRPA